MRHQRSSIRTYAVMFTMGASLACAEVRPDPKTLEDAQTWVLGEWTAPFEQAGVESQPGYWEYLRFEPGDRVVQCTAMGSDDSWGACEATTYEVSAARYSDTGEDYFRIRLRTAFGWSMVAYIIADGVIQQRITSDGGISYQRSVDFERGNRHPRAPTPGS